MTSQQYLDAVTFEVNTESVYSIESVFYFIRDHKVAQGCNDYVCLVIRVGVDELATYLGGRYLVQIWKHKERLFQFVHSTPINSHYCAAQQVCYTVEPY
jgi:hypothetical protein